MKFALLVNASPYGSPGALSALRFAEAALQQGHSLYRVFFFQDGVYCGNRLNTPAQDEVNIAERWSALAKSNNIDLVVCAASALKRGVIDAQEAQRYQHSADNLSPGFCISGLAQWLEACLEADRVVSFH